MTRPETCRWCGSRLVDGKCEVCKDEPAQLSQLDALLARMRRARVLVETLAKEELHEPV